MKKARNKPHKKSRKAVSARSSDASNGGEAIETAELLGTQEVKSMPDDNVSASGSGSSSGAAVSAAAQRVGFLTFIRQVRAEMAHVTWPTRNETVVTTIMVFIMVTLAALFFLLADQVLSFAVAWILGAR